MDDQLISHYHILRKLGGGGMGVIYEAEDTKLSRRVALKFLPEATAKDPATLERFLREARAASALNHPGICTIHAIEEHEGKTFLVLELLEGESLEQLLARGLVPLSQVVDVGIQAADALDAAHKKGIVHRDIKPANLFLTARGQLKILDFGLVKLLKEQKDSDSGETLVESTPTHLTSPGIAVGTVAYMSPEQARGEDLDGRSDLFSLGAVLYQMSTGQHPFPGATTAVIFANILHSAPAAPISLNPEIPPELERILNKALEKDRDLRYQVAAELRADLKRLQREMDPTRVSPGSGSLFASSTVSGRVSAAPATPPAGSQAQGSSALIVAAGKHKFRTGLISLTVLAVLLAAGFGIYSLYQSNRYLPFQHFAINNITNNGHVPLAAISPDGKYLLYAMEEDGLQSLWLRHIASGSTTQVVEPAATRYAGLTFSPDGSYLYFVRRDEAEHTISILYQSPMLGGTPHILVRDVDSPVVFSPDGHHLAFLRQLHDSPTYDLVMANSDGTGEKYIFQKKTLNTDSYALAWSPDGKTIVIPVVQPTATAIGGFLAVDVAAGSERIFGESRNHDFYDPVWLPDGSGLIASFALSDTGGFQSQLGLVSFPDAMFRAITDDTNDYSYPSIAADGRTLVVTQSQEHFDVAIAPASDPDQLKTVPLQSHQMLFRWNWLPDGRLVLPQGGAVKVVSPDGAETVLLSDSKHIVDQATSCPGDVIVFRQIGRGGGAAANLWSMDASGSNQKQLTFGLNEENPHCSSDGKWVYYVDHNDNRYIKRVPLSGGSPETVVNSAIGDFALSPDGKQIASLEVREFDHKLVLRLDSTDDHKTQYFGIDQRASYGIAFSPDGKSLVYTVRDKGADNLWSQDFSGAAPRQLTHFSAEHIWEFAYSPDGTKTAIERGHVESDAVLLRDTGK
ncbi:MAG TPA: protein kinase [Terriglobales bacterium]|nr:protein kinase [Terriglobales bacterium]